MPIDLPFAPSPARVATNGVPAAKLIAPAPAEIVTRIEAWGLAKAQLPIGQLAGLGVLAGLFISVGGACAVLALTGSSLGLGPTRVLGGVVFSLGLMLVVLTGAELSTGNCLLVVPWLTRGLRTGPVLRNWAVSFTANAIGALMFACLVAASGIFDGDALQQTLRRLVEAKLLLTPSAAFVRGVLCNVLVCLAVWMSIAAATAQGKMLAVLLPITAFVALGFEHSVANVFLLTLGLLAGVEGDAAAVAGNLLPVTLGNAAGGALIAAALAAMHGQSVPAARAEVAAAAPGLRSHGRAVAAVCLTAVGVAAFSHYEPAALPSQLASGGPQSGQMSGQMSGPPRVQTPGDTAGPVDRQLAELNARLQRVEAADRSIQQLQARLATVEHAVETGSLRLAAAWQAPSYGTDAGSRYRTLPQPAMPMPAANLINPAPASVDTKATLLAACQTAVDERAWPLRLWFQRNQGDLDSSQRAQLASVATMAAACPKLRFVIRSFTDSRGAQSVNRELALQRANLVRAALLPQTESALRAEVEALGAASPLAANDTEAGRNLNRRIEVTIRLEQ
jgi:formate/nitrite transporter